MDTAININAKKKKIALALGGGGAAGAFECGVLKVFEKAGFFPDLIVGCSTGAIQAAGFALGRTVQEYLEVTKDFTTKLIFPFNKKLLIKPHATTSISSQDNLQKIMYDYIGDSTFDDCTIPFHIVATRLRDGKEVFFNKGRIIDAMMASAAIIPYFEPYEIDGELYIDGGFADLLGLDETIDRKDIHTIFVNLRHEAKYNPPTTVFESLTLAMGIMGHQNLKREIDRCKARAYDFTEIRLPHSDHYKSTDFSCTEELIALGTQEAEKVLPELQKIERM